MYPVVLDCDTGEDDALAILLAVTHSNRLRAVVSCFGNTSVANAARNSADVLQYADVTKIPVIRGCDKSLQPHLHRASNVDAVDFVGENGLCNMTLPRGSKVKILKPNRSPAEAILKQLRMHGPVDYIVTGPCTNLARVILHGGPEARKLIRRVFIMGGALRTPGNTGPINTKTGAPFAEFNFYCDPHAVDVVLSSDLDVRLVTWDTTSKLTIPYERYRKLQPVNRVGTFCKKLMEHFFSSFGLALGRNFELNDPVTVLAAMGEGSFSRRRVTIITDGLQFGRSVLSRSGYPVSVMSLEKSRVPAFLDKTIHLLGLSEPKVLE